MIHPIHNQMLDALKELIRCGTLSPAKEVDAGTFVCLTEATPHGFAYHQTEFERLPEAWQALLKGKQKGFQQGPVKLVAVFDVWLQEEAA